MNYVYSSENAAEAHMISHMLEREGIMAQVHEPFIGTKSRTLLSTHSIRISVIDEEAKKAIEVIANWEKENPINNAPSSRETTYKTARLTNKEIIMFLYGCVIGSIFTYVSYETIVETITLATLGK